MNKKAVVILGPTATHKTKMSLFLAEQFPFEIISADSMQFYRGMNIGTDKIPEEKRTVIHHLMDIISVEEEFSIARFKILVEQTMENIFRNGNYPLIVGGSGLYIRTLTEGFPVEKFAPPQRQQREALAKIPIENLRHMAEKVDPISTGRIGKNDRKRLTRVIEYYESSGKRLSEIENKKSNINFMKIGLFKERAILYKDIENRVDKMFNMGFIEEVKMLKEKYPHWSKTALQAIGYREVIAYLNGEITIESAKEEIKKRTRHLAKKQITWFKKEKGVIRIDSTDFTQAKEKILPLVKNFLKNGGAEGI